MSKVAKPSLRVSVKTLEAEQAAGDRQKALRLVCRAMIRLYLQSKGNPTNGKRLGVLSAFDRQTRAVHR